MACLGCGSPAAPPPATPSSEPQPISITVAPVEMRAVERAISAVGTLHGFERFTITPKVEGRISRIHIDVGDRVSAEALLLEIDETDYRLAVEESQRELETELSKLDLQQPPTSDFDAESVPSVLRASLLVERAQQQFDRQKKLATSNASSAEAYELAATEYKVAQALLRQARLEVRSTLAAVRHRQAVIAQAEQRLAECQVFAPRFDPGPEFSTPLQYVVAKRMTAVGEMVRAFPSTPVCELVLDDVLKFRATIPERYVSQIAVDQAVKLHVDAWPGEVFPARLVRVNPTVDQQSRTFEIEAQVANRDHRLKHGGFAKAQIITQASDNAVTIPFDSVVNFAGVTKVFRVRGERAEEVVVQLGTRGAGWIEAAGDLQPGDLLATSGQSRLANGTPVKLRSGEPSASSRSGNEVGWLVAERSEAPGIVRQAPQF